MSLAACIIVFPRACEFLYHWRRQQLFSTHVKYVLPHELSPHTPPYAQQPRIPANHFATGKQSRSLSNVESPSTEVPRRRALGGAGLLGFVCSCACVFISVVFHCYIEMLPTASAFSPAPIEMLPTACTSPPAPVERLRQTPRLLLPFLLPVRPSPRGVSCRQPTYVLSMSS